MYIVAIAWLYVVLLVSFLQDSIFRGIVTFLFTGLFPLAIVLYLAGGPQRSRNRRRLSEEHKQSQEQTQEQENTLADVIDNDNLAPTTAKPMLLDDPQLVRLDDTKKS